MGSQAEGLLESLWCSQFIEPPATRVEPASKAVESYDPVLAMLMDMKKRLCFQGPICFVRCLFSERLAVAAAVRHLFKCACWPHDCDTAGL